VQRQQDVRRREGVALLEGELVVVLTPGILLTCGLLG
jgi:hypothetical protein